MGRECFYNILMYSHDTYGLGHIRRTMAIAAQLRSERTNVLILTGSPLAGRFAFPEHVDFVRIPGMIKETNDSYRPLSIRIAPHHALEIRKALILATAKTFGPDLFIVDKEPLGLKKEVLDTLSWLNRHSGCRCVLGLRDIMDDRETVREDWRNKGVYDHLDTLYHEIWVYGRRDVYDAAEEYGVPARVRRKMVFTGYLPRHRGRVGDHRRVRKKFCRHGEGRMVVVTAGGGGDGYPLMDTYLAMLERYGLPDACSLLVTGPFLPRRQRRLLGERADRLGVRVLPFYPCMEELFAAADLVVSMGGYNTICEILSQQVPALIVPREKPRKEQLLRAQALERHGLVAHVPPADLDPRTLRRRVDAMLQDPAPYRRAMAAFPLDGMDTIRQRLHRFRRETP